MKTIDITTYRINRLLKERGWSQAELAQKIGVTQQTIQKWVRGKSSPSMENIDNLVELTGLPSHWFMLPPDESGQLSQSSIEPLNIGTTQIELLQIFNCFPKEDQEVMLNEMKEKKEEMDKTIERWLEARKGRIA